MTRTALERRTLLKIRGGRRVMAEDWVVVEEPLEIRVQGESLAVLMRTPGDDLELVAGFALTEGVVARFADIGTLRQCRSDPGHDRNVVDLGLAPGVGFDAARLRRSLVASAACGICGRTSLEALAARARPVATTLRIRRAVLEVLPGRLLRAQAAFGRTGALHAAALFDAGGRLLVCREDVGRHNAVDKTIGRAAMDGIDTGAAVLLVSGRTSFEILQKAAVAGIPVVCAISGPTTLAIETARHFGITLVNFLRGRTMNIATAADRVTVP
jgi:FdhD protein